MDFSVPTGRLTERARSVDSPAWEDALRWLKSATHFVKTQVVAANGNTLPAEVKRAFEAAAPRMRMLTAAQQLSVAGELRTAFQHAHARLQFPNRNVRQQFMAEARRCGIDLRNYALSAAAEMDGLTPSIVRRAPAFHPAFILEAV